jgi:hypothetical protein
MDFREVPEQNGPPVEPLHFERLPKEEQVRRSRPFYETMRSSRLMKNEL